MAKKTYTGIFAKTLTMADFNTAGYNGQGITEGVPVEITYQVLPANEVAFGSGSNSLGGVRTARVFQLNPKNNASSSAAVQCKFRLIYSDANRVRQTVVREDLTENVATFTGTGTQASFLPETTGMRVGAYAFLVIQFTPITTDSTNKFSAANTEVQVPCTFYTLANASGQ
jgi:hypothetical protein